MKKILMLLLVAMTITMTACNSPETEVEPMGYQNDFEKVYQVLNNNHPDLYRVIEKDKLDQLYNEKYNQIKQSTSKLEFQNIIRQFLAEIGDGHMNVVIPDNDLFPLISDYRFLPVHANISDGNVTFTDYMNTGNDIEGEVLSINGEDIDKILSNIKSIMIVEGNSSDIKEGMLEIEYQFSFWYAQYYLMESEKIDIVTTEGSYELDTISVNEFFSLYGMFMGMTTVNSFEMTETYALIKIGSFAQYDTHSYDEYATFLDSAFNEIDDKKINDVFIDIRNNQGGNPYSVVELLRYMKLSSFDYFLESSGDYKDIHNDIEPYNGMEKNFNVIYNSGSFSSASHFLSIIDNDPNVTLIGGVSNGSNQCFGGTRSIQLKESGMVFYNSTKIYSVNGTSEDYFVSSDEQYLNEDLDSYINKE